jgi:uncharacterized protein (DUF934 family)
MKVVNRQGSVAEDAWHLVGDDEPAGAHAIVSLSRWNAGRAGLGEPVGVVLRSDESPVDIADVASAALVAIDFPSFTDGRGYSSARLLRSRLGYKGEIRAVGDVMREQLFYMRRCGIDSFAVKAGKPIEKAAAGLTDFSLAYQAAADDERPLFRRVKR